MQALREQLIEEIQQIPDTHLLEVFNFVCGFRQQLEAVPNKPIDITQFAGAWSDMEDAQFAAFETEWQTRRQQAFNSREYR